MENEDIYKVAHERVKAKKGFFIHLVAYLFVLGLLYVIMYFENYQDQLPTIIVAISWGIAIAIHYFKVFGTENLDILGINPNWEEDALEDEIRKLKRKRELREELQKEKGMLDELDHLDLKEIEKRSLDDDTHS